MSEIDDLIDIEHGLDETLTHILAGDAIEEINQLDDDEEDFELKLHFHHEKTDDELTKELLALI